MGIRGRGSTTSLSLARRLASVVHRRSPAGPWVTLTARLLQRAEAVARTPLLCQVVVYLPG
jgi:hypothetical protein